jgi:ABC-type lipoprotein release transport system permease subunit
MGAVWYRCRAELRTRWRAWLGLLVLVGLAGGAVIALVAGARRTDSAYGRFLVSQRAFDVIAACPPAEETGSGVECDSAELARLPEVDDAALVTSFGGGSVEIVTEDGRSVQPDRGDCGYTGPGEVSLAASRDNRFGTQLNRLKILDGRAPDPKRAGEVAVPVELARRLDLRVGDGLRATFLAERDADCNDPEAARLPPRTLRIVAIEAAPFEIAPPSGYYSATIHLTPVFLDEIAADGLERPEEVALRLDGGAELAELRAELDRRGAVAFQVQAEQAELVERAIRPQAVALSLVAALTALAVLAVLGQALARMTFLESAEHPTLRALGLSRAQLFALDMTRALAIGIGAATLAVLVGSLLSGFTPIGLARTVEPDPGLSLDATALAVGAVATLLLVLVMVALPAWRLSRVAGTGLVVTESGERSRPSLVAGALGRAAFPPTAVIGVRMATEPGRGRTAVPVRSTLVGVTVGVSALAAAITFSAGLTHLLGTPRLQGFNWDAAVQYPYSCDEATEECVPYDEETVYSLLASHPDIDEFASGTFFYRPFFRQDHALELGPGKVAVDLLTFGEGRGTIGPTIIRGRAPTGPGEILVGTEILDELGLDLGDTVVAIARAEEQGQVEGPDERSARLEIVGTGVVATPAGQLGRGAAMTLDGVRAFDPEAGPEVVWLRLASGANPRRVVAELAESAGAGGDPDDVIVGFEESEAVLNVKQVERLPLVLAGLMGTLAAGVLAHVLVSAVRTRRRDLAVLKTLGFVRPDVAKAVAWQATTTAAVALLVGVPLGIAAGRAVWRLFAEELGVLPEPVVPWWPLALAAAAAIVLANAVAAVPAWLAARTRPAVVLRAE